MGTEATKYFRVRCPACKYREDHESKELASEDASEHDTILHNGKRHAELGRFHPVEQYWAFPA